MNIGPHAHTCHFQGKSLALFLYEPLWPFFSLERDGRCATTSMSAGQTSECPKVLRLCWTFVSMYSRGGKLQSRVWAQFGQGLQGAPLWLCTAVLASAVQVTASLIMAFKYAFTIHLVVTLLNIPLCVSLNTFELCGVVFLAYRSCNLSRSGYHLKYSITSWCNTWVSVIFSISQNKSKFQILMLFKQNWNFVV